MKVVISPSQQTWNSYAGGLPAGVYEDSEAYWCRQIAAIAGAIVKAAGHDVLVPNEGSYSDNVAAGNAFTGTEGVYQAIHTNAFDGTADGTITFYKPDNANGKQLADAVHARIAPLSPGTDYSVRESSTLREVNGPTAKYVALVELEFHDNLKVVDHIRTHVADYGKAVALGILDVIGGTVTDEVIYRVNVIWAEDAVSRKKVEDKAKALGLTYCVDGPVFIAHANTDKTKALESVVASDPKLHRFDSIPGIPKDATRYFGVADGIGLRSWLVTDGKIDTVALDSAKIKAASIAAIAKDIIEL